MSGIIKPAGNAAYYGLTKDEWLAILARQGNKCPICGGSDKKWVTDHYHIAGWKKMPPEERKKYVRGILCTWCNFKILAKGVSRQKLLNAIVYLDQYENSKTE